MYPHFLLFSSSSSFKRSQSIDFKDPFQDIRPYVTSFRLQLHSFEDIFIGNLYKFPTCLL